MLCHRSELTINLKSQNVYRGEEKQFCFHNPNWAGLRVQNVGRGRIFVQIIELLVIARERLNVKISSQLIQIETFNDNYFWTPMD